jgi:hypothetical protein
MGYIVNHRKNGDATNKNGAIMGDNGDIFG